MTHTHKIRSLHTFIRFCLRLCIYSGILLSIASCGENTDTSPAKNTPPENASPTSADHPASFADNTSGGVVTNPQAAITNPEEAVDPNEASDFDPELEQETNQRVSEFLQQTEEQQSLTITEFDGSHEDALLVTRLLEKNISTPVKRLMLDTLVDGDYEDIVAALHIAMASPESELVIAAIEIMEVSGTPDDIPSLQQIANTSSDPQVKESALNAIQLLQQ